MADQKRRLIIFGCRDEFHPFEAFLEKKFVTSKDSDAKGSQLKGGGGQVGEAVQIANFSPVI